MAGMADAPGSMARAATLGRKAKDPQKG